jgi:glycosyltransferase involved in cell wall biosynthesis
MMHNGAIGLGGPPRNLAGEGKRAELFRLLSIGSVVPGKGYDALIAAVATLVDLPWRLTIAGDRTRNPAAKLVGVADAGGSSGW